MRESAAGAKPLLAPRSPHPLTPLPLGEGRRAAGCRPPLRPAMSPHAFLAAGRARPRRRALFARRLPLRPQRRARQMAGGRLRRRPIDDAALDRRRHCAGADDRLAARRPVRFRPGAAAGSSHPVHGGRHLCVLLGDALPAARRRDDLLHGGAADPRRAVGAAARRAGRALSLDRRRRRLRRRGDRAEAVAVELLLAVAAGAVRLDHVRARPDWRRASSDPRIGCR